MDEVIPNLWIGDITSAQNAEQLKAHNIRSILTAMRGKLSIFETFTRHQINIDDTEDADILQYLVSAVSFIQAELDKGYGVLVHCQAGMSRSATIVAAYLMVTEALDVQGALELIRKARPNIHPNEGFIRQLEVFHKASFKVSKWDKETRLFYLERVVHEVMNGDGTIETDFFAKFPRSPTDTPGVGPRRRIRCKMCRQELAGREHMLDHGQLGPPTPAFNSAAPSRRPSMNDPKPLSPLSPLTRRPSTGVKPPNPLAPGSRRPSRLGSMTDTRPLKSSLLAIEGAAQLGQDISDSLTGSAIDESEDESIPPTPANVNGAAAPKPADTKGLTSGEAAEVADVVPELPSTQTIQRAPSFGAPDIAGQLSSHPKLAALRSPGIINMSMTPLVSSPSAAAGPGVPASPAGADRPGYFAPLPPILANPKCSGYFVEPMKWMEPYLEEGHMAGKIMCPNKKCNVKLGNYDWAGVCCSCKEWVVPGFCIHRSKVDEIF